MFDRNYSVPHSLPDCPSLFLTASSCPWLCVYALRRPGSVQLVNPGKEQLLADYQAIRALEKGNLFELL
jgi:hypothetical protein